MTISVKGTHEFKFLLIHKLVKSVKSYDESIFVGRLNISYVRTFNDNRK